LAVIADVDVLHGQIEHIKENNPGTNFDEKMVKERNDFLSHVDYDAQECVNNAELKVKILWRQKDEYLSLREVDYEITRLRKEIKAAEELTKAVYGWKRKYTKNGMGKQAKRGRQV